MNSNGIRTLLIDGREIRWVLARKRVKNVNLRVKPDGIVYISANTRVPLKFIENFIREKSEFIFSALENFSKQKNAPALPKASESFHQGDTVCYLGIKYTLSINIGQNETVQISGKEIIVTAQHEDRTGKLLEKFYAEETQKLFDTLNRRTQLMFLAKGYQVKSAKVKIREMRSRWGSCHISDGKIVMNSRLALYPEVCAAYVFVHEYAHFIVPNHSAEFYAVVADIMPDYKICADMLKG